MNDLEKRVAYLEKTIERLAKLIYEMTQIISGDKDAKKQN